MKPTFVIYGNCQGGVLEQATKFIPEIADHYEVVYFRSFVHPTEGKVAIDADVMARCAIFWKQLDESVPFAFDGPLPEGMKEITFPPVDLGVLWPFQTHDALFGSEPEYEYGLFPYGDRILMDTALEGLSGAEGLQRSRELAEQRALDLDRHLDIEAMRLMRREQGASVKLAAYVLSNFKVERLFWAYNHPTRRLLAEILNRLAAATWPGEARKPGQSLYRVGDRVFKDWDPLDHLHIPIHPIVAQSLGLQWWDDALRYRFHGDQTLTQAEYASLYLAERVKRQQKAAV